MLDRPPYDSGTPQQWFTYFRLTMHVGGMPAKMQDALEHAPSAAAAEQVLTAYTAACIDILMLYRVRNDEIAPYLRMHFDMTPQTLLHLDVAKICDLLDYDPGFMADGLRQGGYTVSPAGRITGYTPPRPPAPKAPKP